MFVFLQVLKEAKVLVWVFMVQNLPQVAFFIYLMYTVSHAHCQNEFLHFLGPQLISKNVGNRIFKGCGL